RAHRWLPAQRRRGAARRLRRRRREGLERELAPAGRRGFGRGLGNGCFRTRFDPVLGGLFQGLHQQAHRALVLSVTGGGVWGTASGCGRKRWKNLSSSASSVGFVTTVGRMKITSSVFVARSLRNRNSSPRAASRS